MTKNNLKIVKTDDKKQKELNIERARLSPSASLN